MSLFSKREYLFVFRRSYVGPLKFDRGDLFWSKVKCKVENGRESFIFHLDPWHPDFDRLNEEYKCVFKDDWSGEFIIPCSFVRFADDEKEFSLRSVREDNVASWKAKHETK